jgi:hypothetical protein
MFCEFVGNGCIEGEAAYRVLSRLLAASPEAVSAKEDIYSQVPLHILCRRPYFEGKLKLVEALFLCDKSTVSVMSASNYMPAHYAVLGGDLETLAFLLDVYPDALKREANVLKNLVSIAAESSTEVLRYLLHRSPDLVSVPDSHGKLPLHFAAEAGDSERVELLYDRYPAAARTFTFDGTLPLHYTLWEYQNNPAASEVDVIRFLLRRCPESANMCGEVESDVDTDDDDDFDDRMTLTPYQLSRHKASVDIQRLFLHACPAIDPERLRQLTYEARRSLIFLAFAARENTKGALRAGVCVRAGSTEVNAGRRRNSTITGKNEEVGSCEGRGSSDFIYHLRRLMSLGKDLGLLKHIASFL